MWLSSFIAKPVRGWYPIGFLVVAVIACGTLPGSAVAGDKQTILVLGDSLSAAYGIAKNDGWVSLLEKRLGKKGYAYDVVNASVSGETTGGGLRRLPMLLKKHQPEIVIVELGANDGLRGQMLDAMRSNLTAISKMSQEAGAKVLILGMHLPPNYGSDYAAEFHHSFQQVSEKQETSWLPFFLDGVALKRDLFQEDGIHPTSAAQKRLLNNVWQMLLPILQPLADDVQQKGAKDNQQNGKQTASFEFGDIAVVAASQYNQFAAGTENLFAA